MIVVGGKIKIKSMNGKTASEDSPPNAIVPIALPTGDEIMVFEVAAAAVSTETMALNAHDYEHDADVDKRRLGSRHRILVAAEKHHGALFWMLMLAVLACLSAGSFHRWYRVQQSWLPHPRTRCGWSIGTDHGHGHEEPFHLHLAPGVNASTSITVSFASNRHPVLFSQRRARDGEDNGSGLLLGVVYLGTSPDNLSRKVISDEPPQTYQSVYPPSARMTKHAIYQSHYQHHITIDGLETNTKYYYRVAVEATASTANKLNGNRRLSRNPYTKPYSQARRHSCLDALQIRTFVTAPAPQDVTASNSGGDSQIRISFAILGDLGQFEHSQQVIQSIGKQDVAAAILVGDVAYTDYDHREWDTFFDMIDDVGSFDRIPLAIAAGNHDIDKQATTPDIFQAYEARFRMPRIQPPQLDALVGEPEGYLDLNSPKYPLPYEYGNSYYSFTAGPVLHMILNIYASVNAGSAQYNWLVETLSNVDRDLTPWITATLHTPFYNTFVDHQNDEQVLAAREHLEPIFCQFRVNIVFSGHVHAYQRTHRVAHRQKDPKGPRYVTVGAGGRAASATFNMLDMEPWLAARDASMFGYGVFTVFNATTAHWEWVPVAKGSSAERFYEYNVALGHPEMHLASLGGDETYWNNQYYQER